MKYRTKGMRRRGDSNKWEVPLIHTDPLTGEDVTTYHTIEAKTRKQAEAKRTELIIDLEASGLATTSKVTVKEFLDTFIKYKANGKRIEPSTARGYQVDANWICKYLGAERLCDISIPMAESWLAKMSTDGYSPRSITKAFRLLKQAMKHAVAQDLITKNPCDYCKPPKRPKTPINALSREDRSRMLEIARAAGDTPLAHAIILALQTGMRRGELCALKWSDYDEEKGTITVRRALGYTRGGYYEKEPKSSKSRTIPLTYTTRKMLSAKKADIEWLCERLKVPLEDMYILGNMDRGGRPYNPSQIGKDFAAFCKMNNFDCTLHDLRHTFATFMIASETDVRTVASYLGHASVSMTLDVYADVDPEAKIAAVDKIEEAFDDPMSVYERGSKKELAEFERRQEEASRAASIPAEQIPFTEEELLQMLEMIRRKAS